jgi:hypothetical protein
MPNYYNPKLDIKDIWCGTGPCPSDYARNGTRVECLQQGVGVGKSMFYRQNFPDSLKNIPYATDEVVDKLKRIKKIKKLDEFFKIVNTSKDSTQTKNLIHYLYGNDMDRRVFNCVCRFLYANNIPATKIPKTINPPGYSPRRRQHANDEY